MTTRTVDLRTEAAAEARRLARARTVFRDGDGLALVQLECDAAWITIPGRSRLTRSLGRRVCLVWRAMFEDASGRPAESRLVAVLLDARRDPAHSRREWIRSLLPQADALVRARAEAECDAWATEVRRVSDAFLSARLARERDISRPRAACGPASQPGLFDRRVERQHQARAAAAAESDQAAADRLQTIAAGGTIARRPARLLLVLVP